MIDVKIEPHRTGALAGKYDVRAFNPNDPEDNLLVYSAQGYENSSDAEDMARKVFGSAAGVKLRKIRELVDSRYGGHAEINGVLDDILELLDAAEDPTEHVDLTVVNWEGRGRTEPIR